jgi:hypothetical protein
MDLRETSFGDINRAELAHDRVYCHVLWPSSSSSSSSPAG